MGRLRQRQATMQRLGAELGRREKEGGDHGTYGLTRPVSTKGGWEDALRTASRGGPTVLAFLFARPESDVIRSLDSSGDYFDIRTGSTWDLFFPGYFRSADEYLERQARSQPVRGDRFAADWYFSPRDFDFFCRDIKHECGGRWSYSGDSDLVLVNGWLEPSGEPTIDWDSTISGKVGAGGQATLGAVIERMTNDLTSGAEDAHYGVGDVVAPDQSRERDEMSKNEVTVAALLAIAAALGVKVAGLG